MRFVAQWFVQLLERFPFLETSAFLVIGVLGIKLMLSIPDHFYPEATWSKMIESETADLAISALTAGLFFIPIITSHFFNWPKKVIKEEVVPRPEEVSEKALEE